MAASCLRQTATIASPTLAVFFRLMMQPPCLAEVVILPPMDAPGRQRRQLASEAEAVVRAAFEATVPHA